MEVKYFKTLGEILYAEKDDAAFVLWMTLSVYRETVLGFQVAEIKFLKKLPFKDNAVVDQIKDSVLFFRIAQRYCTISASLSYECFQQDLTNLMMGPTFKKFPYLKYLY